MSEFIILTVWAVRWVVPAVFRHLVNLLLNVQLKDSEQDVFADVDI